MLDCTGVDLTSLPGTRHATKRAVPVDVHFASAAGTMTTMEGEVRYARGDALLSRQAADRWPVPRAVFDGRYRPMDGQAQGCDGRYEPRPLPALARRVDEAFFVTLSGGRGTLRGAPGDWLVSHARGALSIVAADIFTATYELIEDHR